MKLHLPALAAAALLHAAAAQAELIEIAWDAEQHFEGSVNYFTDPGNQNDLQFLAHILRHLFNVCFIACWKNNAADACAMRS